MKLEDIGFYTLLDDRARKANYYTPLWRCELLLTHRCNFKCTYCRGLLENQKGDIPYKDAIKVLDYWISEGLVNLRFSGGEPTLYKRLIDLVAYAKNNNVERIALSTNGSADLDYYIKLHEAGINDFSISLDGCCSSDVYKMSHVNIWDKLINNIKELSKICYVTVGVVLTEENIGQLKRIIEYAHNLGVADIRIITAAQWNKKMDDFDDIDKSILEKHPILKYRLNNINHDIRIRGLYGWDNKKCPLSLDDMVVVKNKHYPCIIYLREGGEPIGEICKTQE